MAILKLGWQDNRYLSSDRDSDRRTAVLLHQFLQEL